MLICEQVACPASKNWYINEPSNKQEQQDLLARHQETNLSFSLQVKVQWRMNEGVKFQ